MHFPQKFQLSGLYFEAQLTRPEMRQNRVLLQQISVLPPN